MSKSLALGVEETDPISMHDCLNFCLRWWALLICSWRDRHAKQHTDVKQAIISWTK